MPVFNFERPGPLGIVFADVSVRPDLYKGNVVPPDWDGAIGGCDVLCASPGASWRVCGSGEPPYDFLNLYGVFDCRFSLSFS